MNLKKLYPRYRYRVEEGHENDSEQEINYFTYLECREGIIYPYDDNLISIIMSYSRIKLKKLEQIPNIKIITVGDIEVIARLPLKDIRKAFKIMRPLLNEIETAKIRTRLHG